MNNDIDLQSEFRTLEEKLRKYEGFENMQLSSVTDKGYWQEWSASGANGNPVRIIWSKDTGCHEVHGGICQKWLDEGGPGGSLGLPIEDEKDDPEFGHPGGRLSRFQHGTIHGWPIDSEQPRGEWELVTEIDDSRSSAQHPHDSQEGRSNKRRWELPPKAAELKKSILSKLDEIDRIASSMLPPDGDLEDLWQDSQKAAKNVRAEIKSYLDAFDSSTFFIVTFGMLKAGKSTLVNALVGHRDVSPVGHGRETTKRSSIIFAADAEHPEGIYIYKPKGNRGEKTEEIWHKELCESLILALGGVGKLEDRFALDGDKPQPFSKENIEKLLTKKPAPGALPPVIRVSPEKPGNLLDDGVAILDTPGLDGLEANRDTDTFWKVLPSQGDFFLLVQSSMSGLNENAAKDVKSIYGATERNPSILIVYNKIVSEFWLRDDVKTEKLEKDEEEVETYLRNQLHDVSKGAEVEIISVNAGAASAALFGNPREFSREFSENSAVLLEQSQIEDLSEKLRGMLQRSRMQIKIDRLKGLMGQCLANHEKLLESKLIDDLSKLKADSLSSALKTRTAASTSMDDLFTVFANDDKVMPLLKPVADAAVSMFTKALNENIIKDVINSRSPSGADDFSLESCQLAVNEIVQGANETCCSHLRDTIVPGTAMLQIEPWSQFHPSEELEKALSTVMAYLHGASGKETNMKAFLASLFEKIDANALKEQMSYSVEKLDLEFPSHNKLQRLLFGDYVRQKDWETHVRQLNTRLKRHFISGTGYSPASIKLRNFIIESMKAAGMAQSKSLQKQLNTKIGNEASAEKSWREKNNNVILSMQQILKLEKDIHKAISSEE